MPGFDLILFDCDGVLVDSEVIAAEVESKLLRDSGFDITPEDMCIRFAGMDWKSILLTIEQERLQVVGDGRLVVRSICAAFDAYFDPAGGRHSKAL